MKKILSVLITFVLTGCSSNSNVNYIEGKCIGMCPTTDLYYRAKEKVKVNEEVIIETKTKGFFKISDERQYDIDFTDLTPDDFDFYVKIDTEREVYRYKLSDEEKTGILYGTQKGQTTQFYIVKHDFVIDGEYFNNEQKFANWITFTIVPFSSNDEILLLSRIIYSQLVGKTIIFSTY